MPANSFCTPNQVIPHGNQGNFLDKLRLEAVRRLHGDRRPADPLQRRWFGPGPVRLLPGVFGLVCGLLRQALLRDPRHPHRKHPPVAEQHRRPGNRYNQIFKIQVELPEDISEKDRQGILRSIDRCTVKKVVQTGPEFVIEVVDNLDADAQGLLMPVSDTSTYIPARTCRWSRPSPTCRAFSPGWG
jgi:hypothetical protein